MNVPKINIGIIHHKKTSSTLKLLHKHHTRMYSAPDSAVNTNQTLPTHCSLKNTRKLVFTDRRTQRIVQGNLDQHDALVYSEYKHKELVYVNTLSESKYPF